MLRNFKGLFMLCILFIFLILAACSSNTEETNTQSAANNSEKNKNENSEETYTLKISSGAPAEHIFYETALDPFIEEVYEATNGRVQFEVYPAEQLVKTIDAFSMTAQGVADIAYFVVDFIPSEMPYSSSLIAMPGLVKSAHQGSMAYTELANQSPMLEGDFLNNGVRPISLMTTTPYELFTNGVEIKTPEDIKNMKLRAAGGLIIEFFDFAGATPVQVTSADLYEALERGVVDAINIDPTNAEGYGVEEPSKAVTKEYGFGAVGFGFVINDKLYQDLPEDIQEAIMNAGKKMAENYAKVQDDINAQKYESAYENKVVFELSDDERMKWQSVYDEFTTYWIDKQGSDFQELYDQFNAALEKY